jgi:uncharacterized protein (TIGR02145 family)
VLKRKTIGKNGIFILNKITILKKIKLLILLLVVLQTNFITAQKVSNINYRQEQSNIIVSYNLETKTPCKVNLFVSTNGGSTWQGPLTKVSGDVGVKIASGSHSINWNVIEEFEELRGDKIQFQVRADGENIETVVIGTQEWTTKNLDVSTYRNGDIIPEVKDPREWAALTTGAWCYYNNDSTNGTIYGKLYNWYAVSDPRGLAPAGFHVPTDSEWTTLTTYLGGETVAGCKMKATGTALWESPNTAAINSSGFTGLPGGSLDYYGAFNDIGNSGSWWSSSEYNTSHVWSHLLNYNYGTAFIHYSTKTYGFSVRCLRD